MKMIKQTIIVGEDSRKSAGSGIARGAIGGALLGPLGLLAGLSAKNKNNTTFLIIYEDDSRTTRTVATNSKEFKEFCKYLKI